ncbi:MAG: phage GP46 family protein [Hyphomicrobiaceae bacterium]
MSWKIRLRSSEACGEQPFLSPDLVLKVHAEAFAYFDFDLAGRREVKNRGGLRSTMALQTSVIIQLFADARARDDDRLPDDLDPNRRGWWGDGVARADEQGDTDLGSRLWLLQRELLNDEVAQRAKEYALEALQVLVDQGAVAVFEVDTEASHRSLGWGHPETGVLAMAVRAYGRDGAVVYDERFEVLWEQLGRARGERVAFAA